jgi:hypothetical protein
MQSTWLLPLFWRGRPIAACLFVEQYCNALRQICQASECMKNGHPSAFQSESECNATDPGVLCVAIAPRA